MPPVPKGPTGELGGVAGSTIGWAWFAAESEHVPELQWPDSVRIFERMLTDSQVWALYVATALRLLDYVWWIDPGDADADYAQALAADLGLPLGEPDENA